MATPPPTHVRERRWLDRALHSLFLGSAPVWLVALAALVPVVAAVAVLFAPGRMLSREMTWDLLYLLEGAWSLQSGQVPYVDFHLVMGPLVFELTRLGFLLTGLAPQAAFAAELFAVIPIFLAATIAAPRRLPFLPALLFVTYVSLLVLLPVSIGDSAEAFSMAMLYNRWGWSALTTLCLVLFVPARAGLTSGWADALVGLGLLFFLFYLKITFALAGAAAIAFALATPGPVRTNWRLWATVLAVVCADALSPHNRAYLADLWMFARSGYVRVDLSAHTRLMLANRTEYVVMIASIAFLAWLGGRRHAPPSHATSAAIVCGLGVLVFSQNAQVKDIPLAMIPLLVIYHVLHQLHVIDSSELTARSDTRAIATVGILPLVIVLAWPLLSVVYEVATLGGYYRVATRTWGMRTISETNLRGLVVERSGEHVRYAVSQVTYVDTLLEAARYLSALARPLKVMVVDQSNPFPFMLGYAPPRGGNLWLQREVPPRPASQMFGDADIVLVPKFSTSPDATGFALQTYGDYLAHTFPHREELPSWTVLGRAQP